MMPVDRHRMHQQTKSILDTHHNGKDELLYALHETLFTFLDHRKHLIAQRHGPLAAKERSRLAVKGT
jgi:hypothetical protein